MRGQEIDTQGEAPPEAQLDLIDLETIAVQEEESRLRHFLIRAWICSRARHMGSGAVQAIAVIYKRSARWIKRMGGLYQRWGPDLLDPDLPHGLYLLCESTEDPLHWFKIATDPQYRNKGPEQDEKGSWSTRDLQNALDRLAGREVSTVTWYKGQAEVHWNGAQITLDPSSDWQPSGEEPGLARVTIREVLIKEEE